MTLTPLSQRLRGRVQPSGYVSFRSALIHHGIVIDSLAVIQVATVEWAGRDDTTAPGPVHYLPLPRDLFFGYALCPFEGDVVPVASAEKALLDWIEWTEQMAVDPQLDEIEWDGIDRHELDRLAAETGVQYQPALIHLRGMEAAVHDQDRMRRARLPR